MAAIIRVLIADDQEIVRQGLGVILRHQEGIEVVGFASDGEEALAQASRLKPDVVVMDLKMPRLNGIQATRSLAREQPEVKVVVLTTYDGDEWVFDAIRAGAIGYLLKDSDAAEIVPAIEGAMAGEAVLDPAVATRVLREFNRLSTGAPTFPPNVGDASTPSLPKLESLTAQEQAVLQELAQGKSNREIAQSLYLAEGTVKNYVSSIIAKLRANDRTQAAIIALKRGLATLE